MFFLIQISILFLIVHFHDPTSPPSISEHQKSYFFRAIKMTTLIVKKTESSPLSPLP